MYSSGQYPDRALPARYLPMSVRPLRRAAAVVLPSLLVFGCAGRPRAETSEPESLPERRQGELALGTDAAAFYRGAGLLAGAEPVAFVGTVHFLSTGTPDTTMMLVAVSIPNRALTFIRENDRYRAGYEIRATLRRAGVQLDEVSAREQVRVGSFPETERADESVIFQEFIPITPGFYELQLVVRDLESARVSTATADLAVPRYLDGHISSPMPVHDAEPRLHADSIPRLIVSPRATGVFGRDSTITVYLEAYGGESTVPVQIVVRGDQGTTLYRDSVQLSPSGDLFSGTIGVPVARLGIGASHLSVTRTDTRDSSVTPVIVSFDENLPLLTLDQMVDYLQYFSSYARLRSLRGADPEGRARIWGEFLRDTDPDPSTPENEALRSYFQRIAYANIRFREDEAVGWRSDRGMVYVAFGEPDQIFEQTRSEFGTRGRRQIWDYRQHRLQLVFIDDSGFGRWRLTTGSEVEFRSALARTRSG